MLIPAAIRLEDLVVSTAIIGGKSTHEPTREYPKHRTPLKSLSPGFPILRVHKPLCA